MPYIELANRVYNGPGYIDLGAPDGRIWEARFDLMPLSDGSNSSLLRSYLAACGLTLARASSATVQTSASTVVVSGIGVDDPRIGDAGLRGLVMEEGRTNSCDLSSPWTWGATGTSKSQVTGPDGVAASATRIEDTDGAAYGYVARSVAYTASTQYIASCWINAEQSTPAGENLSFNTNDGAVLNPISRASVLGTWARKSNATYVSGAGPSSNLSIVPVYSTVAGLGAASFYGFQRENGKFVTELIPTTGASAARQPDRLVVTASNIVRSGRIGLAFRVKLKGSIGGADNYAADPVLWKYSGSNYALVYAATGIMQIVIAGSSYTTSSGFTAAVGDVVDYWVEAGGGSLQTIVKARKSTDNGATWGAVTTLGTTSAQGTVPSSTPIDLFGTEISTRTLSCWAQFVRAYAPGRRPAWAA